MTAASAFAATVAAFVAALCEASSPHSGFDKSALSLLAALLAQFSRRVAIGVDEDALPLTEIAFVKRRRARLLVNAGRRDGDLTNNLLGYRSVRDIAQTDEEELARRLKGCLGPKPLRFVFSC
jgi:replicative superfamily II helicase